MSPRLRAAALTGAAALLCSSLTACGGGSGSSSQQPGKNVAADLKTCRASAKTAPAPYGADFPPGWPFPPQTTVFHVEHRARTGSIVSAVSSARFKAILDFMNQDVAGAGYRVQKGETEAHDAEADWTGKGFRGRWTIRESASCPGETVIQVLSAHH